jgi:transposase-like protein
MITCPHCQDTSRQVKAGFTRTGSQRYQCQDCRRQYTPEPRPLGYDDKTKVLALKLYLEGNGFRRIGRLLSVNHQSVVNWINAFHAQLQAKKRTLPAPGKVSTLEMDELFTFIGTKKSQHLSSPSLIERRAQSSRTRSARREHRN